MATNTEPLHSLKAVPPVAQASACASVQRRQLGRAIAANPRFLLSRHSLKPLLSMNNKVTPLRVRTRPRPVFRPLGEPGTNRIPFDIRVNAVELPRISHPMVEALVLPERLPNAPQSPVGSPCCRAFPLIRDPGQICFRRQKNVDMVRHHREGVKQVSGEGVFSACEFFDDGRCNSFICQPSRARGGAVEFFVHVAEASSWLALFPLS